jgi:hypothetical protein
MVVDIPSSEYLSMKEVGYSFWIKASYTTPDYVSWGVINAWPGIAGMYDVPNKQGYCSTGARSRFLGMW